MSWLDSFFTAKNYTTVQGAGTPLPAQPALNFIGAGVTAADDPTNNRTNVTVTAASPTGTGIPHIVSGVQNAAASLIVNADVDASAAIAGSKISPTFTSVVTAAGLVNSGILRMTATTITQAASPYTPTTYLTYVNHSAPVSIPLPTNPTAGDRYKVIDYACVAATHAITIDAGSGNKIRYDSAPGDQTRAIPANGASLEFVCVDAGATKIWKVE